MEGVTAFSPRCGGIANSIWYVLKIGCQITEHSYPAALGRVALAVMPSAFGMMVYHPMVHGFRPMVTP